MYKKRGKHIFVANKAQVSLFIAIGIIMLLMFSGYYIFKSFEVRSDSEYDRDMMTTRVPVEFQPVISYVDSCLIRSAEDAAIKLGGHGGYIDPGEYGIVANEMEPTESNAFLLFPDDRSSTVPYWHYFKSPNSCRDGCVCSSEQPYLTKDDGDPSIERQMDDYINVHLTDCLNDFDVFKPQGFTVLEKGEPVTDTRITTEEIIVNLEFPIEISKDKSKQSVEDFQVKIPLDLYTMYELANELVKNESKYNFFEKWTKEQITGFSLGLDEEALPPTSESAFDPRKKHVYWSKMDAEKLFKENILVHYVPFLQVFDTANYNHRTGFYQRATLPLKSPSGRDYSYLDVTFEYLTWWDIFFDITGRGVKGDSILPENMFITFIDWLTLSRYVFYYQVSYPVKVEIFDPYALNGKGYKFIFGMEVNLRDNDPIANCSNPGLNTFGGAAVGIDYCDPSQYCANLTLEVINTQNYGGVEDVAILAGGDSMCYIGKTYIENDKGKLRGVFPECIGSSCRIEASKYGYFAHATTGAIRCGPRTAICYDSDVMCEGDTVQVYIDPIRERNITLRKIPYQKVGNTWQFLYAPRDLSPDEIATITFERLKDNPGDADFTAYANIEGSESAPVSPGLVPGNYEVTINIQHKLPDSRGRNKIVFQSVTECVEEDTGFLGLGGGGCNRYETYGPEEIDEDTFPEGGATFNWTLQQDQLDAFSRIMFYGITTIDVDLNANNLDYYDLTRISSQDDVTSDPMVRTAIEPDFI